MFKQPYAQLQEDAESPLYYIPMFISHIRASLNRLVEEIEEKGVQRLNANEIDEDIKYLNTKLDNLQSYQSALRKPVDSSLKSKKEEVAKMIKVANLEARETHDMLLFYKNKLGDKPVQTVKTGKSSRPNR